MYMCDGKNDASMKSDWLPYNKHKSLQISLEKT